MKILIGYDGSEPAKRALNWTGQTFRDAAVTVISIAPTLEATERIADAIDPTSDLSVHQHELEEAAAILDRLGVKSESILRAGNPAEEIINAANGQFDLIVVGIHGMSAIRRFLIGSVADRVVRHATRPVLVVR